MTMDMQQALDFIHSIARFGSKPGLRRVSMLLERMGNPQDKLNFIHVAGTNGKGSTCTMLSYILNRAGYRTGLYISPFVLDFRERIQVDNQMIEPQELTDCAALVKSHWDELDAIGETPTEFEVVVAIAMEYFVRKKCDIVVLEVGMGGRLDATNVIDTPLCSIITSIGIDHVQYLGDTIEKIAFEKSGIIKPGGITVAYPIQEPEALAVIMEQCAKQDNPLHIPHVAGTEILEETVEGNLFCYDGREWYVPLAGRHQVYNAITVLEALKAIASQGFDISTHNIREGMAATNFPCRLETLSREPLILLDGAHNLSGAQALGQALSLLGNRRIHAVMGMVGDKDISGVLDELLPRFTSVTAVSFDNPRAMSAEDFAHLASTYCNQVTACDNHTLALRQVLNRCERDDAILLCGSLYLASELRPLVLDLLK